MRLSLLLQSAGYCLPAFAPDMEVSGISLKIEDAVPGSVFVCVKGRHYDSHADALTAGKLGCFVVGETKTAGVDLPVENARSAAARLCAAYWNHPERRMRLIGVTGTNGKTTTAYLLQTLLSGGYIGTLGAVFGGKTVPFPGTTPEPSILYPLLADMADAGVSDAVMEVSSQALAQRRTDGVRFALGIFLNLSRDHLDYHGSMEDYFSAKCRLAEQSESLLVNADDAYGRRMLSLPFPARPYTFARRNAADADFVLTPGECGLAGSSFTLIDRTDGEKETFFLPLIGEPLRDDAAAAVCAAKLAKGVSFAAVAKC